MRRLIPALAAAAVLLAGCAAPPAPSPTPTPAGSATPAPTTASGVRPVGEPRDIATGLDAPWSILRLDGETLVSQRDDARIVRVAADGSTSVVGTVPGVDPGGEGGLLGLAFLADGGRSWVYAYLTASGDNRIVRMPYDGTLGEPQLVLDGIRKAGNHNGGRIAFGPDGMLYATAGDAGHARLAQEPGSLNGKILRMTPTGGVPADNPTPGSYVYSLGHRNPQGLAWDADGQLWAAEFGQNTWDEFNRIEAGANYGWPEIEGRGGVDGFTDPVAQWPTSEASPSGLAYVDGTFFLAALRGQRLWAIQVDADGEARAADHFVREFGRLRDVTAGSDGTLWFLTNNTDGRGDPRGGDDRILEVRLEPREAG